MNISIEKKIRMSCIMAECSVSDLAKAMDMNTSNMSTKLKRCIFSLAEMEKMAEFFGCEYRFILTQPDGSVITNREPGITTYNDAIALVVRRLGLTLENLGDKLGITRQAAGKKIKDGVFNMNELFQYAEVLGCTIKYYFDFGDDVQI